MDTIILCSSPTYHSHSYQNFNGSSRINFTDKCQQLGSSVCRNGYCVARPYGDYECRCQYGYEQAADRKSCHMNMNPYLSKSKSICFFQLHLLLRAQFEVSFEACVALPKRYRSTSFAASGVEISFINEIVMKMI